MIKIRHKETGELLYKVRGYSLNNANLAGAYLNGADLRRINLLNANLREADLSGAELSEANLVGADLSGSYLIGTQFNRAYLDNASLNGATLNSAILAEANLRGVDLSNAYMVGTYINAVNFSDANLHNVKLNGSILSRTILNNTYLTDANFTDASFEEVLFINCPSLSDAIGLDQVNHSGSSTLDVRTLRCCACSLSGSFLRNIGYIDEEIKAIKEMHNQSRTLSSCFISYHHTDYEFAKYLHNYLELSNVLCWMSHFDMQGGRYWRPQISEAIKKYDKVLVVCFEEVIQSRNVGDEITEAIEYGRSIGTQKLFPVLLDDYVLGTEAEETAKAKLICGEWRENCINYIRAIHMLNFSEWQNSELFGTQFQRLLCALKTSLNYNSEGRIDSQPHVI